LIKVKRKQFFFEKKNQKTFVNLGNGGFTSTDKRSRRFFGSFFSKKELLSCLD